MYEILDDKVRTLIQEVTPWITGAKCASENFAPIFKNDTPDEIKAKFDELVRLSRKKQS